MCLSYEYKLSLSLSLLTNLETLWYLSISLLTNLGVLWYLSLSLLTYLVINIFEKVIMIKRNNV